MISAGSPARRRGPVRPLAVSATVLVMTLLASSCILNGAWTVLPSIDPDANPVHEYELSGVSCVAIDWCMTVDIRRFTFPEPVVPRVWDGSTWTSISSPLAAGSTPGGNPNLVECATTTLCAVLYSIEVPVNGQYGRFAIWDGSTWTQVPMEVRAANPEQIQFDCAPDGSCLFIDYSVGVVSWDGTSFTSIPKNEQAPPIAIELDCFSKTLCYAFDTHDIHTWDGTSWSITVPPPPRPSPGPGAAISWDDISCPTPTTCLVVGHQVAGWNTLGPAAARYAGGTWTMTPLPEGLERTTQISCASPAACLAIGQLNSSVLPSEAVAWIGNQWVEVDAPPPVLFHEVLSCGPERCLMVGSPNASAPENGPIAVAFSWDDTP